MKESETKKLLSMLRAQYQHRFVIDDMTQMVWHGLLNDAPELPAQAVFNAAMTWMKDNAWPPQVRDLRDIIASQVVGIPDADTAWNDLQKWLRAGYPGMPDKRPPLPALIAETVRELGGTSMIRQAEKPEAMREKFTRAYDRRRREQVQESNVTEVWASLTALQRGDGLTAIGEKGKVA